MFSLGKAFQYKGKPVKLSTHEFITLLKIRASSPHGTSGYKLIADLGKIFAGSWSPQTGTIYPILKRLADIKDLIIEKEEKTPVGPVTKVYKMKQDLDRIIDGVVLANYKTDLHFLGSYVDFLVSSVETGIKAGTIDPATVTDVQASLAELLKTVQAVQDRAGSIQPGTVDGVKCGKCGEDIDRIARFCPSCGDRVQQA